MVQGVYVLTDSSFRPFARMSMAVRGEAISMAQAVRGFLETRMQEKDWIVLTLRL